MDMGLAPRLQEEPKGEEGEVCPKWGRKIMAQRWWERKKIY